MQLHTGTGPTQSHTRQIVPCHCIPVSSDCTMPLCTGTDPFQSHTRQIVPCHCVPVLALSNHTLVRLYHATVYRYWPYPITLVRLYHATVYRYWPYPITHSSDCTMPLHTGIGPTQSHTHQTVPCHCVPVLTLSNHTLVRLYHATVYRYWPYPITHSSDCTMPLCIGTGPTQSHSSDCTMPLHTGTGPTQSHSSDCTMPLCTGTGPTQSHTLQTVPCHCVPVLVLPYHTLFRLYHATVYRYWPYPITHSSDCTMPLCTGTGPTQSHTLQTVPCHCVPVLVLPNHTHQTVPCHCVPVLALPNHTLVRQYHATAYRYWSYPITHSSDCTMPLCTGTDPTQSHSSDCIMYSRYWP